MRLFFFLLLAPVNAWADPIYTTLFYDGEGVVYLGLKKEKDKNSEAKIVYFQYPEGERTHIELPQYIAHRSVIGVLPDREKLFVITNGEDSPRLDLYNRKKKTWKKIGAIKCASFTSVRIAYSSLTFACETGVVTRKGKVKTKAKVISLGRERLFRSGRMRFPEFLLRFKGIALILEGNAPTWERLRLKEDGKKDQVIQAKEFYP